MVASAGSVPAGFMNPGAGRVAVSVVVMRVGDGVDEASKTSTIEGAVGKGVASVCIAKTLIATHPIKTAKNSMIVLPMRKSLDRILRNGRGTMVLRRLLLVRVFLGGDCLAARRACRPSANRMSVGSGSIPRKTA